MRPRDDEGASSVEYGLLLAAIATVVVAIVVAFGGVVQGLFSDSCASLDAKIQSAQGCGQ
jgi:pilus assembly protein Flp/PilA